MTDKRFKLGYVCGDYGLIDNDEWIDLHSMSENSEKNVQICINKMNELAEKNEQLQEQREELFIRERDTKNDWRELKQENELLKSFIDDLTTKGTGRIDLANGYSYRVSAVLTNWKGEVE